MPVTVEGWRTPFIPAFSLIDPATTSGQQPDGLTGRTLVMSEEFNGSSLIDTDVPNGYVKCRSDGPEWACWYPDWAMFSDEDPVNANHTNTNMDVYYQRNRVSLASGSLVLDVVRDFPSGGKTYTGGMLQSLPGYTIPHGRFIEVRAQMSAMDGKSWPAAWTSSSDFNTWPPEIDFMEAPTGGTTLFQNVFNSGDPTFTQQTTSHNFTLWHTYGVDWQATTVTFYVDGAETASTSRTLATDQFLLLDNAVQSGGTFSSQSLLIDYIRVWQ